MAPARVEVMVAPTELGLFLHVATKWWLVGGAGIEPALSAASRPPSTSEPPSQVVFYVVKDGDWGDFHPRGSHSRFVAYPTEAILVLSAKVRLTLKPAPSPVLVAAVASNYPRLAPRSPV